MKISFNSIVIALLVGTWVVFGFLHFKSKKLAYIDTAKLMEESTRMKNLREVLQKKAGEGKARVDTLTMQFEMAIKLHEKQVNKMSAKERQLAEELLRAKQKQLVQYQQAMQQKLQQEEQKMNMDELRSINLVITEYGKKKGYDLIFATANGNIAYASDAVNVTEEVIELVNH